MESELIKILYIDDEKAGLFNFEQLFHDDFEVYTALSAAKGMEILATTEIQIIVSDLRMPDKTCIEFFAEVAQLYPDSVRILLTAYSEASVIIDAINRGQVYQCITKPFETRNVKNILDKASQNWRLKKENEELIVQLQNKNKEYEAINEELRQTNEELYAANKNIVENKEKFKNVFEAANVGKSITSPTGEIYINKAFCEMLGYTSEELQNKRWQEITPSDEIETIQKELNRLQNGESDSTRFNKTYIHKNCSLILADVSVVIQLDTKGKPLHFITTVIDITERTLAEEALKKSEQEFRYLAESVPQIVWTTRADGWNIYFNQQWVDYTGMTLEESTGHGWNKPFHPDDQQRALEAWQNAVITNSIYSIESRLRRFDGEYRWWLVRGVPLINMNGEILKWFGTCTDIEDMKQAEENLRTSEAKFRAVAELSPMAIYSSSGIDQKAVYINEAFYKIFGFSMEDVPTVGHWWIKAFPDEKYRQQVIDQWTHNIEQADKNNTDVEALECTCTCKDGSEKIIAWVGKTIGDEFWAFGYDFTERKQAEDEIHRQLDELRRWYEAMIDREDRVLELKKEVNELLEQSGEPLRYASQQSDEPGGSSTRVL